MTAEVNAHSLDILARTWACVRANPGTPTSEDDAWIADSLVRGINTGRLTVSACRFLLTTPVPAILDQLRRIATDADGYSTPQDDIIRHVNLVAGS